MENMDINNSQRKKFTWGWYENLLKSQKTGALEKNFKWILQIVSEYYKQSQMTLMF